MDVHNDSQHLYVSLFQIKGEDTSKASRRVSSPSYLGTLVGASSTQKTASIGSTQTTWIHRGSEWRGKVGIAQAPALEAEVNLVTAILSASVESTLHCGLD